MPTHFSLFSPNKIGYIFFFQKVRTTHSEIVEKMFSLLKMYKCRNLLMTPM